MSLEIPRKWEFLSQQFGEMLDAFSQPAYEELQTMGREADEVLYRHFQNEHTKHWIESGKWTPEHSLCGGSELDWLQGLEDIIRNHHYCIACERQEFGDAIVELIPQACKCCPAGIEVGFCIGTSDSLYVKIITAMRSRKLILRKEKIRKKLYEGD